jgi:hypothetical protein
MLLVSAFIPLIRIALRNTLRRNVFLGKDTIEKPYISRDDSLILYDVVSPINNVAI